MAVAFRVDERQSLIAAPKGWESGDRRGNCMVWRKHGNWVWEITYHDERWDNPYELRLLRLAADGPATQVWTTAGRNWKELVRVAEQREQTLS